MIYILIFLLLIHCVLAYILCNREILSPGFFCGGVYLVSCIVLCSKQKDWGVEIQVDTIILIFLFVECILLGDLCVSALIQRRKEFFHQIDRVYISVSKGILSIFFLIEIFTLALYFRQTMKIASAAGWKGSMDLLLQYARIAKNVYGIYVSSSAQYLSYVCEGINYVCLFIFVNNMYNYRSKIRYEIYYLLPSLAYSGIAILTTGRTLLLRMFIFAAIVFMLLYYKNNNWKKVRLFKTLKIMFGFILVASLVFFLAGKLTGKSINRDFLDYIAVYFSSGIAAFNEFMKAPFHNTDTIWGGHTLFGIYTILRKFFREIPILSSPLEMVRLGGKQTTNIYTPIRRYFQDFGLSGIIIFGLGIGAFYKYYYNRMKIVSDPFKLLVFGYMFFPLVEIAIEERIFLDLLTLKTAIVLIVMSILYYVCCKKEYRKGEISYDYSRNRII